MKKIYKNKILGISALMLVVLFAISSCRKDLDGNPPGKVSSNPTANKITPDSASGGTVLVLTGAGLFDMRSIVFGSSDTVPTTFNPNLNTDNSLVFRVPDTAFGGPQNIVFTNSLGKQLIVPFNVIALPSISSVSSYSFRAGESITLTGNNLDNVSAVGVTGTSTSVDFTLQSRKTLLITMPSLTASTITLDITNASGTITTTQTFVNADQAYVFFRDTYENGEQDQNWGNPTFVSTAEHVSGTASFGTTYDNGGWHQFGFGWNQVSQGSYKYISFWMKGGSIDYDIYLTSNQSANGFRAYNDYEKVHVPAKVWTYFKVPLATIDLWHNGAQINQIGWAIKGPDNGDENMYLDDVMFIK